jgi:hypothetical protein
MSKVVHSTLSLHGEIERYITDLLQKMNSPVSANQAMNGSGSGLADAIFSILTNRRFCYLSRQRVERYRGQVVSSLSRRMESEGPFRFFYDIGPGYHATMRPGALPLSFDVGLSELLILSQVDALCKSIQTLYEPGAKFWFVIDNLCAFRTNDIPLEKTLGYARKMRRLISQTDMEHAVDLIVESEAFDLEEYDALLAQTKDTTADSQPSWAEIENVSRFLGRPCSADETATASHSTSVQPRSQTTSSIALYGKFT